MFDIFTEEIEVQIKHGISNLYWFRDDLKKAWIRSGVDIKLCNELFNRKNDNQEKLSKRELMDALYYELRNAEFRRRLEISRNFVQILIDHKNFVPQNEKHRIEIAERSALKLKEIINQQLKEREYKEQVRIKAHEAKKDDYQKQLQLLREQFYECSNMASQKRGYEFERIFTKLMNISGIPVENPFRITGEQIDGAIKYDSHYYLIELKWVEDKVDQKNIASLYLKAEGKMDAKGIYIAMNGYSSEVLQSLPRGKDLKVLMFDGNHITNVISGIYTFQELLEHALNQACLRGEIYCSHNIIC